jgi:hypothetical protein
MSLSHGYNTGLSIWGKKKNTCVTANPNSQIQTLNFCAYPIVFLAIFEQARLKSEYVPCRN